MASGRPTSWVYRVQNSKDGTTVLTVPRKVADHVPQGTLFSLEITAEGLLYRALATKDIIEDPVIPWAKEGK